MDEKLKEHYRASMVLSGVGDAIGYRNGMWEFCDSGAKIQAGLRQLGGLAQITVESMWSVFVLSSVFI